MSAITKKQIEVVAVELASVTGFAIDTKQNVETLTNNITMVCSRLLSVTDTLTNETRNTIIEMGIALPAPETKEAIQAKINALRDAKKAIKEEKVVRYNAIDCILLAMSTANKDSIKNALYSVYLEKTGKTIDEKSHVMAQIRDVENVLSSIITANGFTLYGKNYELVEVKTMLADPPAEIILDVA